MKGIVVYQSRYGETARYARWIADRLGWPCRPVSKAGPLRNYDAVIFGTPIYRGRPLARRALCFRLRPQQKLFIFLVGLTHPSDADAYLQAASHFPRRIRQRARIFSMRGGIRFDKLRAVDRGTISGLCRMIERRGRVVGDTEKVLLQAMDQPVVFTDPSGIRDLVEAVRRS